VLFQLLVLDPVFPEEGRAGLKTVRSLCEAATPCDAPRWLYSGPVEPHAVELKNRTSTRLVVLARDLMSGY
jgi:hypothetical protein